MTNVTLTRKVEASQWLGENHPLPDGAFLCQPEVHFSAGRNLVYFTYADLRPNHWISTEELTTIPEAGFMSGGLEIVRRDGSKYWREALPFAFYSVKSEASVKRDWNAVYLDRGDESLTRAFVDYLSIEGWGNPLPARAEFRIIDGAYGRGFRTLYLKPNDWLVREEKAEPSVLSDAEFKALSA
jgi:hypothetical protein